METNYKEKAEAYVREALPELRELSFGCEVKVKDVEAKCVALSAGAYRNTERNSIVCYDVTKPETMQAIIGHPIQLQHWLRVLAESKYPGIYPSCDIGTETITVSSQEEDSRVVSFNLTTGQPATPDDYKSFCNIVGI